MNHHAFHHCLFILLLICSFTRPKKSHLTITSIAVSIFLFGVIYTSAAAQSPVLGSPPQINEVTLRDEISHHETPNYEAEEARIVQSAALQKTASVLVVDLSTRQNALDFYNANYVNRSDTPISWTGNQASCNAGNTSSAFANQYIHRINYFRAMAGVPAGVTLSTDYNQKAQQAALMMSANDKLSHRPDSNWKCYTQAGKDAAGSSNLFLGMAGVDSVDGYVMDPGAGNAHVGHRRWLLHPATEKMGIGSVDDKDGFRQANAIWVFDDTIWNERPATRDDFVAWPPPGFVPYNVIFSRWSFAYPDADFSNASVSMSANGAAVSSSIEPVTDGFGENTFVWKTKGLADNKMWPKPNEDTPYTVTIRNVRIKGAARDFTYTVTVFDPAVEVAIPSIDVNFDTAAPGSFLTVRGDGFAANQRVPIELNGTVVQNATANASGELAIILNTRGSAEGTYLISAPVMGNSQNTASGYQLDKALPVRPKEKIPGVQTASVRNIAPLIQLFVPLISQ